MDTCQCWNFIFIIMAPRTVSLYENWYKNCSAIFMTPLARYVWWNPRNKTCYESPRFIFSMCINIRFVFGSVNCLCMDFRPVLSVGSWDITERWLGIDCSANRSPKERYLLPKVILYCFEYDIHVAISSSSCCQTVAWLEEIWQR